MTLLNIDDLEVRYADGTVALHDVTFALAAGERMALIGPNGAGKTSLMLAIMGAVGIRGRVTLEGIALSRGTLESIRSRCGMIFQDPEDQLFMPTLLDDVAFGPLNQGLSAAAAEAQSRAALEAVGLAGLELRNPSHLSGGQKRAGAIATVLAMQVKLLLLDEPTAGLDFRSQRRIAHLLAGRQEAMLLSTHDLGLARELCTTALLLDGGHLIACGAAADILDDRTLMEEHGLA